MPCSAQDTYRRGIHLEGPHCRTRGLWRAAIEAVLVGKEGLAGRVGKGDAAAVDEGDVLEAPSLRDAMRCVRRCDAMRCDSMRCIGRGRHKEAGTKRRTYEEEARHVASERASTKEEHPARGKGVEVEARQEAPLDQLQVERRRIPRQPLRGACSV